MAISDISLFAGLKARMSWLQQRQSLLAENVANADTPGFRSRDLAPLDATVATRNLAPGRTHLAHLAAGAGPAGPARTTSAAVKPGGNSVSLEQEMMKVSETQLDYQLATGLYSRGIGILKTALGRRA
jgi:flagellar basal-body rod protein FlgB